jgi:anti-anti-sigma factor
MLSVQNEPGERLVISVDGDFDAELSKDARGHFEEIATNSTNNVVIDFSKTKFLDSSGIGAVVFLYKRLRDRNQGLELIGVSGQPLDLIEMLRIDQVIPVLSKPTGVAS